MLRLVAATQPRSGACARTRPSTRRGAFDTPRRLWEAFARSLIPALIPKAGSGGPKAWDSRAGANGGVTAAGVTFKTQPDS